MEDLERELNEIAWHGLSSVASHRNSSRIETPRSMVLNGVRYTADGFGVGAAWDRLLSDRRRLSVVGAAAFVAVSLAIFGISRPRANLDQGGGGGPVVAAPTSFVARPEAVSPPPSVPATEAPAVADEHLTVSRPAEEPPADSIVATTTNTLEAEEKAPAPASQIRTRTLAAGPSASETRKMLGEGEQLLRAQRFAEARDVFTKLTKTKATRGRALVALAEIAFQEKNYEETIRSAKLAADRGGGARARVLLGDAHFRLNHFQDAATAYGQALRLDPGNPSAKSGLALASKRM
jgi:Flp pilus assembly protein TadD